MSTSTSTEMFPNAVRARDKDRKRNSKTAKKRLHVLLDPDNPAFPGWKNEPMPWTQKVCEKYIDWCHIDKLFPHSRHKMHRNFQVANLHHCKDFQFLERVIQVHQYLYDRPLVRRNEANISILRMVYAEEKLDRLVDWRSIRRPPNAKLEVPESIDIPQKRKYEIGGLGPMKAESELLPDALVEWSEESDVDHKSGCTKEEKEEKTKFLQARLYAAFLDESLEASGLPSDDLQMNGMSYDCNAAEASSQTPTDIAAEIPGCHWQHVVEEQVRHHSPGQYQELSHLVDETTETSTQVHLDCFTKIKDLEAEVNGLREEREALKAQIEELKVAQQSAYIE